jgi:hypothetical protein
MPRIALAVLLVALASAAADPAAFAQGSGGGSDDGSDAEQAGPGGPATRLTAGPVGLGIGDTRHTNGLRLNWRDGRLEQANGINVTVWVPRTLNLSDDSGDDEPENRVPVGTTNGLSLGLLPIHERTRGLGVGGLAVVARSIDGLAVGGFGAGTEGQMNGVAAAGLAAAGQNVNGALVGGLAVQAGDAPEDPSGALTGGVLNGLAVGGLGARAQVVRGAAFSAGTAWIEEGGVLQGVAAAPYVNVQGRQQGLAVGIYNRARVLSGVQIGLVNVAKNNPAWARVLPLLNLNL